MIPNFLIYYAVLCIVIVFIYLKFNLHMDERYKVIIDLAVALFGFLTIFILIQQQDFNNISMRNDESKIYNDILTDMFTNSLEDFISNKDIQYFYNELFHNTSPPDGTVRNTILEEIICFKILAAYGNYSAYYYSHNHIKEYKNLLNKHNYRAIKILETLLNSSRFKIYLNSYLNEVAGLDFKNYLKEQLNYSSN